MLNIKSIIAISLLGLFYLTGMAANAETSPNADVKITNCGHSRTLTDINACREIAYAKSTKKLSHLVRKISDSYKNNEPKLNPLFLDTQKKWESFINTECDFQNYYSRGGAGYNAYFLSCMELQTLKRTKQLKNVLETP